MDGIQAITKSLESFLNHNKYVQERTCPPIWEQRGLEKHNHRLMLNRKNKSYALNSVQREN